jgi:hypothetical protein
MMSKYVSFQSFYLEEQAVADEWNKQGFFNAKKILSERGVHLSDKTIADIQWNRLKEIGGPERASFFLD